METRVDLSLQALRRFFTHGDAARPTLPLNRKYWAFISYSHHDEAWAMWLHRALERYRIPRTIVGREMGQITVPARLSPVFRDRDELPGSASLKEEIGSALQQSHALVVICSPHGAVSRYVNEEILLFKRLGRGEHVHCLLVAGEPGASERPDSGLLEAFPRGVRFEVGAAGELTNTPAEPLAADVRKGKDARTNAKLKLIAGILGIGFDELKRREVRRRKQQRAQLAGMVLAVLLLVIGVWWNRQRAFEGKRQIALAQRLADQSAELIASERPYDVERGVLLLVESLRRLNRPGVDFSADGEAAQARLAADQRLRTALGLFYTHVASPRSQARLDDYTERGWSGWTSEAVAFTQDGSELVAASVWGDKPSMAVKRWRLPSGDEVQSLKRAPADRAFHWPSVNERPGSHPFALSADGAYLLTTSSASFRERDTARVLDVASDSEIARLEYEGVAHVVALSVNAEYVAIAAEPPYRGPRLPLQVWHVPTASRVAGLPPLDTLPASLAFSPDGRFLVVGGNQVRVWHLAKEEGAVRARAGPDLTFYRVFALAFSPDGRSMAAAGQEATSWLVGPGTSTTGDFAAPSVRVWRTADWRVIANLQLAGRARRLALSNGAAYLASMDDDQSLLLHAVGSGRKTRVHYSHPTENGGNDIDRSSRANPLPAGPSWRGMLHAVAFSPDGESMAMAGEVDPVVWRIMPFEDSVVLPHGQPIAGIAFDPDERVLTSVSQPLTDLLQRSRTATVRSWEIASGKELLEQRKEVLADEFVFMVNGALAVATNDEPGTGRGGKLAVLRGGNEVRVFRYDGDVELIAASRNGALIALGSELGPTTPDSTQPGRHRVTVWDAGSGAELRRFEYETRERGVGGPDAIALGADAWYLSVQDARRLENGVNIEFRQWDVKSGQEVDSIPSAASIATRGDIATTAEGRTLATGSGNSIVVLAAPGDRQIARIDLPLEERRDELRLTSVPIALSPRGRYLAAITGKTNVHVWPLAIDDLIRIACARVTRSLTAEERSAYLGGERQRPTCRAS